MSFKRKNKKSKTTKKKGGGRKINIDSGIVTYQTLGDCVKELVESSFEMYNYILNYFLNPVTIICGGQSPSYYCLSMMNSQIYNSKKAEILILPHSKGGESSQDQLEENILYCERLREKKILLRENVVIIDGVHTGTGILSLESSLKYCFPYIQVYKIAINSQEGIAKIPVDKEYILPCEPKFSDTFPRLVISYKPSDFKNPSKFINKFYLKDNPVAEMIIELSKEYPDKKIEDSDWYKKNNILTKEIIEARKKKILFDKEKQHTNKLEYEKKMQDNILKEKGGYFKPIVLHINGTKVYQCPLCKTISGTLAVKYPNQLNYFSHNYDCNNRYKVPKE